MPTSLVSRPLQLRLPNAGVLAAESIHAPSFRMSDEQHPFHEVYFLFRGDLKVYQPQLTEPAFLAEGSIFPIPAGTLHRIEDRSSAVLLILGVAKELLENHPVRQKLWDDVLARGRSGIRPGLVEREIIERSFRTIFAEQNAQRVGHEIVIRGEVDSILVTLARLPEDSGERNSHVRVAEVLRHLQETFFDEWDVDLAARRAQLSRRQFASIFREITGLSFVDKRNELRLDYAGSLIAEGRNTIISAAFSSGFGDLAHFYRLFKRRFGCSPKAWAQRHAPAP